MAEQGKPKYFCVYCLAPAGKSHRVKCIRTGKVRDPNKR